MLFFELLQLSVGTSQGLSFTPSAEEWREAFDNAKSQALIGVCFRGVPNCQPDIDSQS